jgi:selenocysteine-specific elongation factor
MSLDESTVSGRIIDAFNAAGLEVDKVADILAVAITGTTLTIADARKLLQRFLDANELIKVTEEFYFSRSEIDRLIDILKQQAANAANRLIDVSRFKELAGVSRKYAIPLLEYFDREHITARSGDKRLIL